MRPPSNHVLRRSPAQDGLFCRKGNELVDSLEMIALDAGYRIAATATLEGREPRYASIPQELSPQIGEHLNRTCPGGLYAHQAAALAGYLAGRDVCLATSTASGKSLVFQAAAAHLLLTDRGARVLALYPARALIQDQIQKWKAQLAPFDIPFAHIDGGVPIQHRLDLLRSARVLLMTPDVCHAWLLSHLEEAEIDRYLASMRLLILDEAHVYEGVFGTNMAFLLRRLQVASGSHQVICSTATLGKPAEFLQQLTGRDPLTFGAEDDASGMHRKEVTVLRCTVADPFGAAVRLLVALSTDTNRHFLAFADSRRMVEQIVAVVHREMRPLAGDGDSDNEVDDAYAAGGDTALQRVLPYRAGYEELDRKRIQEALNAGQLAGVVSTSALELGIDIGDLDLAVLLGPPPSVKALRQRLGRVGRKTPATCLLIDDSGLLIESTAVLESYLRREPEPSWLYLENRYIQYANVLCAAVELSNGRGDGRDLSPFRSLPPSFSALLENELNPREVVADDLYVLKQRAQGGPHREFPIRSGVEKEFHVKTPDHQPLGTLTLPQALREAYPGAVYYYMARPYRVSKFNYRLGEIGVARERRFSTRPIARSMVFPRFRGGLLSLSRSESAFVAEVELQVREQVLGFSERRGGAAPQTHMYVPESPFYRHPLDRFFQTTGVCWYFPEKAFVGEAFARALLRTFCVRYSVQERDLGMGIFHAQEGPLGASPCQGISIYDVATGSLRLTQRLAEQFHEVARAAFTLYEENPDVGTSDLLASRFYHELQLLERVPVERSGVIEASGVGDWVVVIEPGSRGMYESDDGALEVDVLGVRYTPQGLLYELPPPAAGGKWLVKAAAVKSIHGTSRTVRYNLLTGETEPMG